MKDEFSLTFFGVRGSYPVPGRSTSRCGGNTSSLLFEIAGQPVIFDAGTGIIESGRYLNSRLLPGQTIHIFLTHLHSDHIMGLPFFAPMFNPEAEIVIHCPDIAGSSSRQALEALFLPPYSPITLQGIKARLSFRLLAAGPETDVIRLGNDIGVTHVLHNSHPRLGVLIFRIAHEGRSVVYATDVESPEGFDDRISAFIAGADLLIHDSQYFDQEYFDSANPRKGFGHSTVSMAARNAEKCGVKRLFLFHFDPKYSDPMLEEMLAQARGKFKKTSLAQEAKKIKLRR
jgi:ribonuclease BN (tRNA processing enzyme)